MNSEEAAAIIRWPARKGPTGDADLRAPAPSERERPARPTGAPPDAVAGASAFTVRVDYAPDLCKDYLETGYCGFGDSCKFLHDRGDYKMGWQMGDSDQQQQHYFVGDDSEDSDVACHLCRGKESLVSLAECQHVFCRPCVVEHLRAKQQPHHRAPVLRCPRCKQAIGGSFKPMPLRPK